MTIIREMHLLHPCARDEFESLLAALNKASLEGRAPALFRPYETYRSPARQYELYAQKPPVTKAPPWSSAHQYGLAVDFVVYRERKWSWAPSEPWHWLKEMAERHGLTVPYAWDKVHVEHRAFGELKSRTVLV